MSQTLTADIFCRVIDNYGDAGVSWRLARALSQAGHAVTLGIDDLSRLARLRPDINTAADTQPLDGFTLAHWEALSERAPADVVIATFGCRLPESYLARMAARARKPVWINLDYLSAEAWIEGSHGLPSPHPRLPLTEFFFFPGFTERSGGLLREAGLDAARTAFDGAARARFLARLGINLAPGTLLISLFCYPQAPLASLLEALAAGPPVLCVVPEGVSVPGLAHIAQRGTLTLQRIPFLVPDDYDRLLWSCDLNFVRGEDSAVRAQWARQPFVWQFYPQAEDIHRTKMQAFLDRYAARWPAPQAALLSHCWAAWNGDSAARADWRALCAVLPQLRVQAEAWAAERAAGPELAASLIGFARKIG